MAMIRKLIRNDKGATAIEYGLIAALIAVAAIGAMTSIGSHLSTTFNNVSELALSFVVSKRRGGGAQRRRRPFFVC